MSTAIVGNPLSTTHANSQTKGGFALTNSKETTQRKYILSNWSAAMVCGHLQLQIFLASTQFDSIREVNEFVTELAKYRRGSKRTMATCHVQVHKSSYILVYLFFNIQ